MRDMHDKKGQDQGCLMSYICTILYVHHHIHTGEIDETTFVYGIYVRSQSGGEGVTLTTISGGMSPQLSPSRST